MKASILLLALLTSASFAGAQRAGFTPRNSPPDPPMSPTPSPQFEVAKAKLDTRAPAPVKQLPSADVARLKQDADELASLAQSIPPDVDQTAKGILPKDLDKKLKRIEKLSKELRSRINP
jgi:hypothetical protein